MFRFRNASRVRIWSAIVMVMMGLLALGGGYLLLDSTTTTVDAAKIESGFRPSLTRRMGGGSGANRYQITGRLTDGNTVIFDNHGDSWRCAPLVSEHAGADQRPRIYYAATATSFRRARVENHFTGELSIAVSNLFTNARYEAEACRVPPDAYVLVDDGSLRASMETGRSLLLIAFVIGSLAAVAFLKAVLTGQAPDPAGAATTTSTPR